MTVALLSPVALIVALAAVAYLYMAWVVGQNHTVPAARVATLIMVACFFWSAGSLLRDVATSIDLFLLGTNLAYVGIALLAPLGLLLMRKLRNQPLSREWLLGVLGIPVITILLVWTNPWHELMWAHPPMSPNGEFLRRAEWGPWFRFVHAPISYAFASMVAFDMTRAIVLGPARAGIPLRRSQALCILAATILPSSTSLAVTLGVTGNTSFGPIALAVAGVTFGWAFFRLQLFELRPLAHRQIFTAITDGVIVIDDRNRVIDSNPAAGTLLPSGRPKWGTTTEQVAGADPDLARVLDTNREAHTEYTTPDGEVREVTVVPVVDAAGRPQARAILLRDITARKAAESALRQREAMIRSIVNQSPNGILRLRPVDDGSPEGPDYQCTFFNPAACRYLNVASEDLAGARLKAEVPALVPWLQVLFRHVLETGDTEGIELSVPGDPGVDDWWFRIIASRDGGELSVTFVNITDEKRRQVELARVAATDPLTGLLNRRGLEARSFDIHRATESGQQPIVLFFDLTGFKAINDTHGHSAGDQILQEFARRLERAARPGDAVARVGGDEFVVVTAGEAQGDPATRFLAALGAPYRWYDHPIECRPTVGVGRFGPDGLSLAAVLEAADRAMYAARGMAQPAPASRV